MSFPFLLNFNGAIAFGKKGLPIDDRPNSTLFFLNLLYPKHGTCWSTNYFFIRLRIRSNRHLSKNREIYQFQKEISSNNHRT